MTTRIGVALPQGLFNEFRDWSPAESWERTVKVTRQAEDLGFDSAWMVDHFYGLRDVSITEYLPGFEACIALAGLAACTTRIRLGTLVLCAPLRNPALIAKMFSTLDGISGGRMDLGIGAGWKRDELEAYGYLFPSTRERLDGLKDQLEIITRMFETPSPPGASYEGPTAKVVEAVNLPGPVQQPRLPIMVGGNGPKVTWRLAARYADELNLDNLSPDEVAAALPVIRERCREIGRSAETLRVSVTRWFNGVEPGTEAQAEFAAYRKLGLARVMVPVRSAVSDAQVLTRLASAAKAAGLELSS
jgi:alkanesulfonate monooxygenase SsuD/methylene tetrahydromethanopterin reductase-like flavin-dependent oxidoreductase (luciferase family)